jgi:hypothetical protein
MRTSKADAAGLVLRGTLVAAILTVLALAAAIATQPLPLS